MQRKVTKPSAPVVLSPLGNMPEEVHVFEEESIWAINAALAARRPLLVRGEPGVGKSQLARAAAAKEVLNCPLVVFAVDSSTESRDLLWSFDAVRRLAEAQISGALRETKDEIQSRLDPERFFSPGPLWWAFDWKGAKRQAESVGAPCPEEPPDWSPSGPSVVLIDEIDKAESDVPNGLLEALGSGRFHPKGRRERVEIKGEPPLVIITTNEERVLPDAFVRRCLVWDIVLPKSRDELITLLVDRGDAHFGKATSREVLEAAADLLIKDRLAARSTPIPGQAEFLDLIRVLVEFCPGDFPQQMKTLRRVAKFVLNKQSSVGE